MKKLIYSLMVVVAVCTMTSCDREWHDINPRKVNLSNISIECVGEEYDVHDYTSGLDYTRHTYICKGYLSGFTGKCYIEISGTSWNKCGGSGELFVTNKGVPFEFSFTTSDPVLDNPNQTFTIAVCDEYDYTLCQTNIIAKHK